MKAIFCISKMLVFLAIFWIICIAVAFCCRDDVDIYTRALMDELHKQDKVDVIFCGASHVSHGLSPLIMDDLLGVKTFCTGTPTQHIRGSQAIIEESLSLYDIKEVWFECDFAVVCHTTSPKRTGSPGTSLFLTSHYLKTPSIKYRYLIDELSPRYYLNAILPIGKESLLNLNPVAVAHILASKATRSYYNDPPKVRDAVYEGKGCVMDWTHIDEGSLYSNGEEPINIASIGCGFYDTMDAIISMLDARGVKIVFYSNPSTNFYLTAKGNYDEYIDTLRKYFVAKGKEYYDFSLVRQEYLPLMDSDFSDDNHLCDEGVKTFTRAFCDFYEGKWPASTFCASYKEKQASLGKRVYGVIFKEDGGHKGATITPVQSGCSFDDILIEAVALSGGSEVPLRCVSLNDGSAAVRVEYPKGTMGTLVVKCSVDGVEQSCARRPYTWM